MLKTFEQLPSATSIIDRQEIDAPKDFVSVFHETSAEAISDIDQLGLRVGSENSNIGSHSEVARKNKLVDQDRPAHLTELGLSRATNLYAYPFLHEGHGLGGAAERYVVHEPSRHEALFELFQKYDPEFLESTGIKNIDEYIQYETDPERLKQEYPGEVLELKVDAKHCFVGDLTQVSNIFEGIHKWGYEPGDAKRYWEQMMTLEDFLRWYKKPEWAADGNNLASPEQFRDGEQASAGDYCPIVGAPEHLPYLINQPELLIPEDVPQEYIKLVS